MTYKDLLINICFLLFCVLGADSGDISLKPSKIHSNKPIFWVFFELSRERRIDLSRFEEDTIKEAKFGG